MTKDEELRQGEAAARLLDDPTLQKALASIRTAIADQMWSDAVGQRSTPENRMRLDALAWSTAQFENCLIVMVNGGEKIRAELLMDENMKAKAALYDIRKVRYGTSN
jgi:hypothetical protein